MPELVIWNEQPLLVSFRLDDLLSLQVYMIIILNIIVISSYSLVNVSKATVRSSLNYFSSEQTPAGCGM